jgi:hypothetical protein
MQLNFPDNDTVSDKIYLARLRYWRDEELKRTDWTQLPDAVCDKAAWATYRQTLRDLPESNTNPRAIEFPVVP